jgi:hypothetical protein
MCRTSERKTPEQACADRCPHPKSLQGKRPRAARRTRERRARTYPPPDRLARCAARNRADLRRESRDLPARSRTRARRSAACARFVVAVGDANPCAQVFLGVDGRGWVLDGPMPRRAESNTVEPTTLRGTRRDNRSPSDRFRRSRRAPVGAGEAVPPAKTLPILPDRREGIARRAWGAATTSGAYRTRRPTVPRRPGAQDGANLRVGKWIFDMPVVPTGCPEDCKPQ